MFSSEFEKVAISIGKGMRSIIKGSLKREGHLHGSRFYVGTMDDIGRIEKGHKKLLQQRLKKSNINESGRLTLDSLQYKKRRNPLDMFAGLEGLGSDSNDLLMSYDDMLTDKTYNKHK